MRLRGLGDDTATYVDTRPFWIKARDWLADSAVVNAATAARDWTVDETAQAIQDLYSTGLTFQQTMQDLLAVQNQAAQDPDLKSQYDDLVSRGGTVNSTITAAVRGVQNVVQWVKDNTGSDISASTTAPPSLQGLGFIQVIPLAIIGGVIAATALAAAWIVDARSAIGKIQAMQAAGLTPDQISVALKQSGGLTGAVSSATGFLVVLGIIAAGVYFAPELKKLVSKRG
jgi:hypothetical protein